jgi:hypothetical protein
MKNESVISRIVSAIKGNKIAVRENLFYNTYKSSVDFADDDIPNWRAVKAGVPGISPIAIAANNSGFFDYAYDGSLGANPTAYLQLAATIPSAGWVYWNAAKILDNGHIYAEADFSAGTGDTYRLIIKQ